MSEPTTETTACRACGTSGSAACPAPSDMVCEQPWRRKTTEEAVAGQITVCTLTGRATAFVNVSHVAAIVSLESGGPCRLMFGAGGHLDICGDAEYWRRLIRLTDLEAVNGKQ